MSFVREPNAEPIPGYRLIEPLGSGGFGEAWKCEAPGGIFKAVKFVFGNLDSLDADGARAEQEFRALERVKAIRHPFVLQMDRIEKVNGELVIVMELADKSLHDAFEEAQRAGLVGIPRDTLLRYIRDAAEALDHMNEKHGLQHLDIKPRNLFLVSDRVKVADFGLVKTLERSGSSGLLAAVTPLYASPETFTGEISSRSDQYSLAIVYQELLTGHRPFNGKSARQLANQHMQEPPDLRALPVAERPIVGRALEKDPERRFPSCLAFVRALYAARSPSFASLVLDEAAAPSHAQITLDPLEGIQLEPVPEEQLSPVDLPAVGSQLTADNEAVSRLGVTVAQPSTGALRPTLVIGLGGFGRRALMELRCRFLDRFGDLDKVPMIRFLYLDTDGDAIKEAQRGAAEVAFRQQEVYHLPLQPLSHYRRRQLEQLSEWLPIQKLYALPRSLKTQGGRALGRLAFSGHYQRLISKIKRELQHACHPDALYQTVAQTGLAIRDDIPRVYVICCGTGGSSGYLPDLGYSLRRILQQANKPDAPVISFCFCGAPDDPATPATELANLHATLTELHHFAEPQVLFSAQYGSDAARIKDEGSPFDQVYLIRQQHRTPEARREGLAQLGSYLFHELTTPLGLRLDQYRNRRRQPTIFRSLGTFGVWFPRGLLLRLASRDACKHLLSEWQANTMLAMTAAEQATFDAILASVLSDPELQPDALVARIDLLAAEQLDAPAREALTRQLASFEDQINQPLAQDDPGAWARQTLSRMRDWLGTGLPLPGQTVMQQRRSPLTRALEAAVTALIREWLGRIDQLLQSLLEYNGRRLAQAESAIHRCMRFCEESAHAYQAKSRKDSNIKQTLEALDQAAQNCAAGAGTWSLFGSRSRKLLRTFIAQLTVYARQCLVEDIQSAVMHFYCGLRGKLADRLKDLDCCRQQLRGVQEALTTQAEADEFDTDNVTDTLTFMRGQAPTGFGAGWGAPVGPALSQTPLSCTEAYWHSIRACNTHRVVLPQGEKELETAARRFLGTLSPEAWAQLDTSLCEEVLIPNGGLLKLCLDQSDLTRHFAIPLINCAINRLSELLPITDVAQVELNTTDDLSERVKHYLKSAQPSLSHLDRLTHSDQNRRASTGSGLRLRPVLIGAGEGEEMPSVRPATTKSDAEQVFLLVPGSPAGQEFGEQARQVLEQVHLVNVPGQADLVFCREQVALRLEDLEVILAPSRNAYHELNLNQLTSPHARFDISDWTPLDP